MEIEFENDDLAEIYQGGRIPKGFQPSIIKAFLKTIRKLETARNIEELYQIHSLNYEALSGNKKGFFSVRVNDQYRLEFKHRSDGTVIIITIYELSNHYR